MLEEDKKDLLDAMMALTGASVDEDGNIWCNICNKPNECCTCGEDQEEL